MRITNGTLIRLLVTVVVVAAACFVFQPQIGAVLAAGPDWLRGVLSSAAESGADANASGGTAVVGNAAAVGPGEVPQAPSRPEGAAPMIVDYVHDGDTLFLYPESLAASETRADRLKVRLIGLDTPEVGDSAECFGAEATEHLRTLLPEGSRVWAAADAGPLDTYGRSLFYLWDDAGRFVNFDLVAGGSAVTLSIPPNETYVDVLAAAEESARASGAGLWGAC
ncbi:thermonuclease family protein [Glaciibacter psychrotolerans]|uniref:Micrococcal nuclease n=1 Tax=Glaciibacter psychrotolerans TaxID=670054 RepID=A0A7Z0ED77_9MICO|nr:micrococcal nuclease [Leifsonia psychrotolerans]